MNGVQRPLGYTIIEVMIVLAVSGLMFLIAANFISGKQQRTAFTTGVDEMAARLQDTIEQVSNGKYSDIPLNCTFSTASGVQFLAPTATSAQGKNPQCTFLGKVLHFTEASGRWPAGDNPRHYEVLSVAGGRLNGLVAATTLGSAKPKVIRESGIVDLTIQQVIPQSLDVKTITAMPGSFIAYGIGFFQGQGTLTGPAGSEQLVSGASPVRLHYVDGLMAHKNTTDAATKVADGDGANLKEASLITMCLTDGSQFAEIILGGTGSKLSVEVKRTGLSASCA